METQPEFIASNDLTLIAKGKRSKRHRSSSPAATVTSTSSTGCGAGTESDINHIALSEDQYSGYTSSPASSSEVYQSTEEKEEEDMAYCLILLAQGDGKPQLLDHDVVDDDDDDENCCRVKKFSSRKFFDVSTAIPTNKAGFFVYECKTCNRSFPSFQALGGHRASHKKPKSAVSDQEKKLCLTVPVNTPPSIEDHDFNFDSQLNKRNLNLDQNRPNFSLQLATNKGSSNNKSKIHECSICGSEFTSGQALGGHMRRHRANNNNNNNNTNNQVSSAIDEVKPRNILALDLNLPAPEDDYQLRESKFQYPSAQQPLVFSAPALVDCYY